MHAGPYEVHGSLISVLPKRRRRPTLEAYEVLFEIARGGMGVVYAARSKSTASSTVAIKLMSENAIEHRKHVDMFLDEAWIASCVKDEHVVEVLDAGEHEGLPFLVMEYVPGVSLLEVMRADRKPPIDVVCAILAATARGLHAAHETLDPDGVPLHIVHRDVSPHNVLVGFDGRVKVTDFGVAAARGRRTQTTSGEIKGKLSYMSPEQITREQTTDRRADVWALGVIAWEALAGRKLFTGADDAQRMFAVLRHPIPDLSEVAPSTPEPVVRIVMQALTRSPDARVATADAFARGLGPACATTSQIAEWMHDHFASREHELRDSFTAAEGREPTAVTALSTAHVSETNAANVERPPRRSWAPVIGLALLALLVAGISIGSRETTERAAPGAVSAAPPLPTRVVPAAAPPETVSTIDPERVDPERVDPPPPDVARRTRPTRSPRRARPVAAAPATPPSEASEPSAQRRAASRLLDNPFAHP